MREQKSGYAQQFRPRKFVSTVLRASLIAGIAWVGPTTAIAQGTSPDLQPTAAMRATSPLAAQSTRPAGIPLGSTEIATPGISPVAPSQDALMQTCTGDGAGLSAAPFDGGGISATTALSCADSHDVSSPLPSPSSIERIGIPLGATEIGSASISPATSVTGPALSGIASPANVPSTTANLGNP